jgi:excinuclease UvrABC nuclease subunit
MIHPSKIEGIEEFEFDLSKAYIYFLVDCNNEVVYVGQSISFLGRYTAHKQNEPVNKMWVDDEVVVIESQLKDFNKCYISEVENSKDSLNHWEQHYIRKYLPKYNTCHHSQRIRKEIQIERKTINKFIIDNNLNYEIERSNDKWLIQAK